MVEADVVELDLGEARAEQAGQVGALVPGDVAEADHPEIGVAPQRLGDQAGGVREVDEHRPGRVLAHLLCQLEHDRDRAQRLREAADAGRLLADQAELGSHRLVAVARRLAAHAQLVDDELGARQRVDRVGRPAHREVRARGLAHAPGEAADDAGARAVGVEQHELRHRQAVGAAQDPVDQLGRVGRAAADHADLHPFTPVTVTPSTKTRWARKKITVVGSMIRSAAAIVRFHSTWREPWNSESASESV